MSTKMLNGKALYSMETIAKKFGGCKNRQEARDFIFFIECKNLIYRDVFEYQNGNEYVYYPSVWFSGLIDGHFYAKRVVRKGIESNSTLYFDEFASMVLGRFYIASENFKKKKPTDDLLYMIIARTALDKFIERI